MHVWRRMKEKARIFLHPGLPGMPLSARERISTMSRQVVTTWQAVVRHRLYTSERGQIQEARTLIRSGFFFFAMFGDADHAESVAFFASALPPTPPGVENRLSRVRLYTKSEFAKTHISTPF